MMALDFDELLEKWSRSPAGRRFQYYDPYLTFSDDENDVFIKPNGDLDKDLNPDTEALFRIGEDAFRRITKGEVCSKEEFSEGYAAYWSSIDEFRELLLEMLSSGKLIGESKEGAKVSFDAKGLCDEQVISILWQMSSAPWWNTKSDDQINGLLEELFLFHALREIDNALIGIALDGREAIVAAIGASNALANAIAIRSGDEQLTNARKHFAYHAAIEKLKRDPKQREKLFVLECWTDWQQNSSNYKSKAAFARDMLNKCEHLTSQKKIEDWCRKLEKEKLVTVTMPAE